MKLLLIAGNLMDAQLQSPRLGGDNATTDMRRI